MKLMGACGCLLSEAKCGLGRALLMMVWAAHEIVSDPDLPLLPWRLREEYLELYQQACKAYAVHVEYALREAGQW